MFSIQLSIFTPYSTWFIVKTEIWIFVTLKNVLKKEDWYWMPGESPKGPQLWSHCSWGYVHFELRSHRSGIVNAWQSNLILSVPTAGIVMLLETLGEWKCQWVVQTQMSGCNLNQFLAAVCLQFLPLMGLWAQHLHEIQADSWCSHGSGRYGVSRGGFCGCVHENKAGLWGDSHSSYSLPRCTTKSGLGARLWSVC